MANSFTAAINGWSEKAKRNIGLVVKQAASDIFADMSERQPSIKEIGTFEIGKVPVDTGLLVNSMFAQVNGSTTGQGSDSYIAAVASMEMDDTVAFAYSQDYAPHIEYGTQHFPGRFMVREAINGAGGWQARVDAIAARLQD